MDPNAFDRLARAIAQTGVRCCAAGVCPPQRDCLAFREACGDPEECVLNCCSGSPDAGPTFRCSLSSTGGSCRSADDCIAQSDDACLCGRCA